MEFNFTKEQKINILRATKFLINIRNSEITEEEFQKITEKSSFHTYFVPAAVVTENCLCSCKNGLTQIINGSNCPYCGGYNHKVLTSKENITNLKNYQEKRHTYEEDVLSFDIDDMTTSISGNACYFAQTHPTIENSIIIMQVVPIAKYKKNFSIDDIEFSVKSYIEIIPEKGIQGYKGKNFKTAISGFDFFNINSKTYSIKKIFVWGDKSNIFEFLDENKNFGNYTGLKDILSRQSTYSNELFLQFYLALYERYPSIEKIIKIKMDYLIERIVANCISGVSKKDILDQIDSLRKLINPEAKSAKDVFALPFWMVDILNQKQASLSEILIWDTIFSYDKIGKDDFYKIMNSRTYSNVFLNAYQGYGNINYMKNIADILKYEGYTFKGLINYMGSNKDRNLYTLNDYLKICELVGITPEKYPSQLDAAHNSVMRMYKAKENEIVDNVIKQISDKIKKHIPKNPEYTIVLPNCTGDFVQEGINQHNCVACYAKKVAEANGECIVGFLRRNESVDTSFVTFEINKHGLSQVVYRNNRRCTDPNIIDYLTSFKNSLKIA